MNIPENDIPTLAQKAANAIVWVINAQDVRYAERQQATNDAYKNLVATLAAAFSEDVPPSDLVGRLRANECSEEALCEVTATEIARLRSALQTILDHDFNSLENLKTLARNTLDGKDIYETAP